MRWTKTESLSSLFKAKILLEVDEAVAVGVLADTTVLSASLVLPENEPNENVDVEKVVEVDEN